ncbi:hypothetical protein HF086_012004 [Spodoptera exigua]|uniref:Disintegrin domain-containing protein n=1 Tax=Spodoptera exigua TaxID=7107 RepID=A0A922MIF0_SPOEX|nr:hypothetical protein HF086_012004 [Spodoptera exigua]
MASVLVVCACLLVSVAGMGIITTQHHVICSAYGYQLLEAKFGREVHLLCLKLQPIGSSTLATRHSALFLDPDDHDENIHKPLKTLPLTDITMAYGFPVEDPSSGSAEGYIGEDHQFYGVLHLGNRTLHADPYGHDDPNKYFGAFENDNMAAPRFRRDHAQYNILERVPFFPYRIEERNKVPGVARARICDLLLLADKEFFEKDANSSLNHVVRFSVKYILVLTSNDTNTRVFGDLLMDKAIDGRAYLMRFARLRRLSEVCLGVAFSGHAFHNRTLGLSFTSLGGGMGGAAGGLCDRRAYGRSFNTLAIAHATTEAVNRVPERIAALTLAHEMVEEGESCDCGLPSRCIHKDPCCTPRGGGALVFEEGTLHKDGCSVAPSAMCHPSQGLCCTAKCQLADLVKSGIDCRDQDRECTCDVMSPRCRCGLNGRCLPDGSCHATECATLGLKECQCVKKPRPDGFSVGRHEHVRYLLRDPGRWRAGAVRERGRGGAGEAGHQQATTRKLA